jgi:hypothetical protein
VVFQGPRTVGGWFLVVDSARKNKQKARNRRRCPYETAYPYTGRGFKGSFSHFSRKLSGS